MKRLSSMALGLALVIGIAFAGTASADKTLGTTTPPSGASTLPCTTNEVIFQVTSDPSLPYTVSGAGKITQWQTHAATDTPGSPINLVVVKPVGGSFTVVGVDAENIPNPAPAVATFSLATPIAVTGGETFGFYTPMGGVLCAFQGGATPPAGRLGQLAATSPPATGQTLNRAAPDSASGFAMNLAATFVPTLTGRRAAALKRCKKRARKHHWSQTKLRKCKTKAKKLPI
jgi:hypothetical protein